MAITGNLAVAELPWMGYETDLLTVAVDGSSGDLRLSRSRSAAGAAVASDGRALIGWWSEDADTTSQYAELQALGLGLRLTSGVARAVILTDEEYLASSFRHGRDFDVTSQWLGCEAEAVASGIVAEYVAQDGISVRHVFGGGRRSITHQHPMLAAAHSLAWITRRLLLDGVDPVAEGWDLLAEIANRGGSHIHNHLRQAYRGWRSGSSPR